MLYLPILLLTQIDEQNLGRLSKILFIKKSHSEGPRLWLTQYHKRQNKKGSVLAQQAVLTIGRRTFRKYHVNSDDTFVLSKQMETDL